MKPAALRIAAVLAGVAITQVACYNSYRITPDELGKLQSGNTAESVTVTTEKGDVKVGATTPITVLTAGGEERSVSPFNFIISDTQLVAPDYDLLVPRDQVEGAKVLEFAKGKTALLIAGSILAAAGSFAAISIFADSGSGVGGN